MNFNEAVEYLQSKNLSNIQISKSLDSDKIFIKFYHLDSKMYGAFLVEELSKKELDQRLSEINI